MNNNLVSVVISVFNEKEEYLREALDSVVNQTYREIEVVVVCDGANKNIQEILEEYKKKDNRVIVVYNEKNIGLTKSLNIGLDIAKGSYIARMDSDDVSYPTRISDQLEYLRKHNYDLVTCYADIVRGGVVVAKRQLSEEDVRSELGAKNIIIHSTFFGKKSCFQKRYNENFDVAQDYEFLLQTQYVEKKRIGVVPAELVAFRRNAGGISSSKLNKQHVNACISRVKVLKYVPNKIWHILKLIFSLKRLCIAQIVIVLKKLLYIQGSGERLKEVGLCFTYGVSLKDWCVNGMIEREKLIYERLAKDGVRVHWFTYGCSDNGIYNELHHNIKVHEMPKYFNSYIGRFIYSLLLPLMYWKVLKRVDVIKTNQIMGSWTAVLIKILYRKPLYVRTGYTLSKFTFGKGKWLAVIIEKFAYLFADSASVSSVADLRYISSTCTTRALNLLPNYIDTKVFKGRVKTIKRDVICIARLNKQKNLYNLIDAALSLKITLDIYGEGEMRSEIEKYLKKRKVGDAVKLMGNIQNNKVAERHAEYNFFCLVSLYEGMPKALLEAMASEMVCLGSDVSGIKEVVTHGKNGILCKTDTESISQGMKSIAKMSLDEKSRMGIQARKKILESFSLDAVYAKERNILQEMI